MVLSRKEVSYSPENMAHVVTMCFNPFVTELNAQGALSDENLNGHHQLYFPGQATSAL
jgi:hypothetical protein